MAELLFALCTCRSNRQYAETTEIVVIKVAVDQDIRPSISLCFPRCCTILTAMGIFGRAGARCKFSPTAEQILNICFSAGKNFLGLMFPWLKRPNSGPNS